jgi:hypothetical protein
LKHENKLHISLILILPWNTGQKVKGRYHASCN